MRKILLAAALVLAFLFPGHAVAADTDATPAAAINFKPILGKWKGPLSDCAGSSTGLIYKVSFVMRRGKPVGTMSTNIDGTTYATKMVYKKKVGSVYKFTAKEGGTTYVVDVKRVNAKLKVSWTAAGTNACVIAKKV